MLILLILYTDLLVIGRRARFTSFHTLLSSSVSLSYFISAVPNAQVIEKTHVPEFPISYSHTDWYFDFSLFGARETKRTERALL